MLAKTSLLNYCKLNKLSFRFLCQWLLKIVVVLGLFSLFISAQMAEIVDGLTDEQAEIVAAEQLSETEIRKAKFGVVKENTNQNAMGTSSDALLGVWWNSPLALSPAHSKISNAFWNRRVLSQQLAVYLGETYDYSVYQLDSSADFSQSDAHVFSLLGASWLWNRYSYSGLDISDRFFSGKMLHPIETSHYSLGIDSINLLLDFLPHFGNFFQLKILTAPVGGAIPYWRIVNQIYNHQASQLRSPAPTTIRRSQPFAFELESANFHFVKNLKNEIIGSVANNIQLNYQNRSLLQFDANGYERKFADNNVSVTAIFDAAFYANANEYLRNTAFTALASYFYAEHLYATRYYKRDETARYNGMSLSAFFKHRPYGVATNLGEEVGISLEQKSIAARNLSLPYNVNRITGGEGLYPFFPSVEAILITPKISLVYSLLHTAHLGKLLLHTYAEDELEYAKEYSSSFVDVAKTKDASVKEKANAKLYEGATPSDVIFKLRSANTLGVVVPQVESWKKPVYYFYNNSGVQEYTSLYQMQMASKQFNYGLIENSLGFSFNEVEKAGLRLYAAAGLDIFGTATKNTNVLLFSPYYKIGMQMLMPSLVNLRIEMGRKNIPFTSDFALFISKDYLNSKNYAWTDGGNRELEEAEVSSTLTSTSGGEYRTVDKGLRQPHFYYIDVPVSFKLPKNVVFSFSLHYSIFKDQLWVEYDGEPEDYGRYTEVDGEKVFLEGNGEKRYLVTNLNKDKFPSPNIFNDSPFYVGGTLKLAAFGKRYFFSLAFTAYIVNGVTREGNGFYHNSLGVLEESMAIPQHREIGRLDGDRGYIGRMLVAYEFHKYFLSSLTLSYRDGQPFGVFSPRASSESDAQHINWVRDKVSGDNIMLYNGEFGQREDAIWNLDLRFLFLPPLPEGKGKLELHLAFYNLLDLSLEVLEYFSYADKIEERAALETQHPRSIEIGFRYYY